jgi:transcriptional regulator with XRE-family HTH domain
MTALVHTLQPTPLKQEYLYGRAACYTFTPPDLRLLCGQWLTWHRLQRGLASATIAQQVGLLTNALSMLEFGRAEASTISSAMCDRLGEVLSDTRYSATWISTIIAAACGQQHKLDDRMLYQIRTDLISASAFR